MDISIITEELCLDIYGFGDVAVNKDYTGTVFRLSGKTWETVKSNNVENKGLNIWVYESNERVFAGVELYQAPAPGIGLQQKRIMMCKYAYYKLIGPYSLIKKTGTGMRNEIAARGFETTLPYIEIYGHWTNDESTTETELFMCLK